MVYILDRYLFAGSKELFMTAVHTCCISGSSMSFVGCEAHLSEMYRSLSGRDYALKAFAGTWLTT